MTDNAIDLEKVSRILASEIECSIFEKHVLPALETARQALTAAPAAPAQSAEPVATAYRVERKGYVHWEISRHGDLVNGQKLYAAPQPSQIAVEAGEGETS